MASCLRPAGTPTTDQVAPWHIASALVRRRLFFEKGMNRLGTLTVARIFQDDSWGLVFGELNSKSSCCASSSQAVFPYQAFAATSRTNEHSQLGPYTIPY